MDAQAGKFLHIHPTNWQLIKFYTCLQHLSCQRDFSQSTSANNIYHFSCLHASYHHELYKAIAIIYSRVHATTSTATTLGMGEIEDDKAMRAAFQSHSTAEDAFTVTLAYFNA